MIFINKVFIISYSEKEFFCLKYSKRWVGILENLYSKSYEIY